MERADQRELLERGRLRVEGRVLGSSNQALLVRVTGGGAEALACYKAERAERALADFPPGLWRREVAAERLDELLGLDLVPTTVARLDGPLGPGSLQWWVEATADTFFELREDPAHRAWLVDLAAYDVVANNADRKGGHVLDEDGRLWAIDHGLCFHERDKLRTVVWDYAGEEIDQRWDERLAHLPEGLDTLRAWLSDAEVDATAARARALALTGRLPWPDTQREWPPPYPWPLV